MDRRDPGLDLVHARRTTIAGMNETALGAMIFGTRIDELASFALLDRFVDGGGRWIDAAG